MQAVVTDETVPKTGIVDEIGDVKNEIELEEPVIETTFAKAPSGIVEKVTEAVSDFVPVEKTEEERGSEPAQRSLVGKPEGKPNNEAILAGKLNRKPISDLSSGIPLNEKFGIIRNLFAGNASDFGDAVLKLNNSKSAAELKHYFQLLTQRRDWDMESEGYQLFLGYVERKAGSLQPSEADTDH